MNLLDFKNKLIKGKELGGEVVYIKEDNLLYGIESIYKNHEVNSISLLKSEQNSIKVHDLIEFLERECDDFYEGDVFIGNTIHSREDKKGIVSVEFAQYEAIKMMSIFFYIWLTQLKTGLFYPFYKLDLLFFYPLWLNLFEES